MIPGVIGNVRVMSRQLGRSDIHYVPFQLSEVEAFIIVDAGRPKLCFSTLFGAVCSFPQWHYTGHSSPKHFVDLFYCFHGINRMLLLFWDIVKAFLFSNDSEWAAFRLKRIDCVRWPEDILGTSNKLNSFGVCFLCLNLIYINKKVCNEENKHTITASKNVFRLGFLWR